MIEKINNEIIIRELTLEELSQVFHDVASGTADDANKFFGNRLYKILLSNKNYSAAVNEGIRFLNDCKNVNDVDFISIHKGSAYYWIAIAAFLMNNFELATYFFDASVSEDMDIGAHPTENPTPATRFALIDGHSTNQAAYSLVLKMQARFEELIQNYNSRTGKNPNLIPMDISTLRSKFLIRALSPGFENLRSSATTLLSFGLEWDFNNSLFDIRINQGSYEPFFLHLFKGCLLFETLLKCNPTINIPADKKTLGPVLKFLSNNLSLSCSFDIGNIDFQTILQKINPSDLGIETAIITTGQVRNTLGHNLGWIINLSKEQYSILFRNITSSCLHVISCLY